MIANADDYDPLGRLCRLVHDFSPSRDAIFFGGTVTEIGNGYCNVTGLGEEAELQDMLTALDGRTPIAEISRLETRRAQAVAYDPEKRLTVGQHVFRNGPLTIAPTQAWLGRTLDALGRPVDGRGALPNGSSARPVRGAPPPALGRRLVATGVRTGVKVIDIFSPLCIGQRLGIFAGSGVGKSTLLGMLASESGFDIVVVGLIGERGREVREFIEHSLSASRARAVVVAATGDESALMRRTAAHTTMAIAEHFRDEGHSVLLIFDSVTRYALACREIAIASGEPPVSRGFPPSVFTDLPRLLERAGPGPENAGDITGLFAVLVDGDDHNDPVSDAVRGILDGHVVLDRSVAAQGRYPAVNIPSSLSRLAHVALTPERQAFAARLRALVGRFEESRDLRALGGYQPGADADLDAAVAIVPRLYSILSQARDQPLSADAFREVADALGEAAATSGRSA